MSHPLPSPPLGGEAGPPSAERVRGGIRRLLTLGLLGLSACAPTGPSGGPGQPEGLAGPRQVRTLHVLTRAEPVTLAPAGLRTPGISVEAAIRPFNAGLVIQDGQEQIRPYLAEALPQLNTDTWRVFPDGRMETTWRLKPDLRWHDGPPLTAQDYVFASRVYGNPEFGTSYLGGRTEDVLAPDDRTVVVRWAAIYPDAAVTTGIRVLPRHILEQPVLQSPAEAVIAHPYWTLEYVGLGPYRLTRWEPGSLIEGEAFDGHIWGRPKIDRIVVRFSADENVALANILSENVHLVGDRSIRFEQASILRAEWTASRRGVVVLTPSQNRYLVFQTRPEYANPPSLTDVRVRRAVAHGIDRQAINDGLFSGEGAMILTIIRPSLPYYAEVERSTAKYTYDPRRTEQLMGEAGYVKGSDAIFVSSAGERFRPQLMNQAGVQPERETAIMLETWRRGGIDAFAHIVPVSQSRDNEARATFPALQNASGGAGEEDKLKVVSSPEIGSPQNRWRGDNRGGWSNPDYDRAWNAFNTTLDRGERDRFVIQMEKLISEQLPIVPLFFNFAATAYLSVLEGPDPSVVADQRIVWNIHDWSLK